MTNRNFAGQRLSRRGFMKTTALLVSLTMPAFTAQCAPAPAPQPQAGQQAMESTTQILFWPRSAGDQEILSKLLPLTKEMYPEIEIVMEAPPENIYEKLRIAIAGGTAPDSSVMNTPNGVPMIGKGAFVDLAPYLERDTEVRDYIWENYAPAAIEGYSFQGNLHAIPLTNESQVVWYNLDAMKDAGLTPPAEIQDDPTAWNWDTFTEYAITLNEGEGRNRERYGCFVTGDSNPYGIQTGYGNILFSNEGRVVSEDGTHLVINSPENIEAFQWMLDLIYTHDVHPTTDTITEYVAQQTLWQSNQVAMIIHGEWFWHGIYGSLAPRDGFPFDWDLCMMPFSRKGTRGQVWHGLACPIINGTQHPDEVWKWLKVLASREGQQMLTDEWYSRGADMTTYESWLDRNVSGGPDGKNYRAIVDADRVGVPIPVSPYLESDAFYEPITRWVYDRIFLQRVDIEEGLRQATEETDANITKAMEEMGAL